MVTIIKRGTPKEKIRHLLKRHERRKTKNIDIRKYCGIIKLKEDPLELQKQWRDGKSWI